MTTGLPRAAVAVLGLGLLTACRQAVDVTSETADAGSPSERLRPASVSVFVGPALTGLDTGASSGDGLSLACGPDVCMVLALGGPTVLRFERDTGEPIDERGQFLEGVHDASHIAWYADRFLLADTTHVVEVSPSDLATSIVDLGVVGEEADERCIAVVTTDSEVFLARGWRHGSVSRTHVMRGREPSELEVGWVVPMFGCSMAPADDGLLLAGEHDRSASIVRLRWDGWVDPATPLSTEACGSDASEGCAVRPSVLGTPDGWIATFASPSFFDWQYHVESSSLGDAVELPLRVCNGPRPYAAVWTGGVGMLAAGDEMHDCGDESPASTYLVAFRVESTGTLTSAPFGLMGLPAMAEHAPGRVWLALSSGSRLVLRELVVESPE